MGAQACQIVIFSGVFRANVERKFAGKLEFLAEKLEFFEKSYSFVVFFFIFSKIFMSFA